MNLERLSDTDIQLLVGLYEATPDKARSINQRNVLRVLTELLERRSHETSSEQYITGQLFGGNQVVVDCKELTKYVGLRITGLVVGSPAAAQAEAERQALMVSSSERR